MCTAFRSRLFAALLAVSLCLPVVFAADNQQPGIPYVRIYSDAAGDSHFEDGFFPVDVIKLQSGEEALIHNVAVAGNAGMLVLQPGTFEDWHPSPASQMLVVIQGEAEVGASDGELRVLTPGTIFVMDDNAGKGHTTRTIGDVPHIGMMIPKVTTD
jgi:quercetin dioxygenase-like cupin family protein